MTVVIIGGYALHAFPLRGRCHVHSLKMTNEVFLIIWIANTQATKKRADKTARSKLEERMGFEPTNGVNRYSISNAAPSTTRPPLRNNTTIIL